MEYKEHLVLLGTDCIFSPQSVTKIIDSIDLGMNEVNNYSLGL